MLSFAVSHGCIMMCFMLLTVKGIGYYCLRLQYRETYEILIKGLDKMIARNNSKDGCTVCCLVFFVVGLLLVIPYIRNGDKKISELQDVKLLALAWCTS